MKQRLLIPILLFSGLAFRIILNRLVPQPVLYDQFQYAGYAYGMLGNGLFADPVRLYGYPLLILPIIKFFGITTQWPWLILQSILDLFTALMVYKISKMIFTKSSKVSLLSFIIYLLNPFTSAYAGSLLTEIAAIFFVTLSLYFLIKYQFTKKVTLLLFATLALGYLPQVRPSFIYMSYVLV
ncbi:hypothetical protein ACFL1A_03645, partial [Patescibacteria group bacterium]